MMMKIVFGVLAVIVADTNIWCEAGGVTEVESKNLSHTHDQALQLGFRNAAIFVLYKENNPYSEVIKSLTAKHSDLHFFTVKIGSNEGDILRMAENTSNFLMPILMLQTTNAVRSGNVVVWQIHGRYGVPTVVEVKNEAQMIQSVEEWASKKNQL